MSRWLIDGMNVVGSSPDGWWRDRRGAMARLAGRVAELLASRGDSATVVFDGRPFELDAGEVEIAFAPARGPNAADDEIARLVAADADPAGLTVVTSDRRLAARVRAWGAEVVPAGAFRRRLDER